MGQGNTARGQVWQFWDYSLPIKSSHRVTPSMWMPSISPLLSCKGEIIKIPHSGFVIFHQGEIFGFSGISFSIKGAICFSSILQPTSHKKSMLPIK